MLYCEESSHPDIFDPSVQFLVNLWRFITKNVLCTAWHSFLSPGTQRWHSKSCSNESRLVVYQMPSFFTRYTCDHLGKTLTIVHVIEHWQKKHFFVCSLYRTEYSDNSVHNALILSCIFTSCWLDDGYAASWICSKDWISFGQTDLVVIQESTNMER